MLKSPYLKDNRLADVLTALQIMALNAKYTMSCEGWAKTISGDGNGNRADDWEAIFEEHPEFFRVAARDGNADSYALIWRRVLPRYNVDTQKVVTNEELDALPKQERERIISICSRPPLPEWQIKTLMDMAINLHGKAIEASQDWRWWIAPALSFSGSFLGALIAFTAPALFKR